MAAQLADVFDTTEVTPLEQPEDDDEDVEALMEALYGETQETKNWCKDTSGGIEEDVDEEESQPAQEQEVNDEYVEYEEADEPIPSSTNAPAPQAENFLELLEKSAAGEHENFKLEEAAPTWKDELRRTAEVAAANIEAMTGTSLKERSKTAEKTAASGARFLAYGVMFASMITLLAKASMAQEQTASEAVSAAMASTSARKLKLSNEDLKASIAGTTDRNKLDASGEFTQIDEEDSSPTTDLSDLGRQHKEDYDIEEEQRKIEEENEAHKKKMSDIEKAVNVAKELALKESEKAGSKDFDPEAAAAAAKILESANSLKKKEEAKEAERQAELAAKNHRGISHHSKHPPAFVNNQDQVAGYHNYESEKTLQEEEKNLEKQKAQSQDATCVDSPREIAKDDDGVTGLYCKDLVKHCQHKVHGEGISKVCPATCGLCGTASPNAEVDDDAEGSVQDEATRKAAEEERSRLAQKAILEQHLAKVQGKKEAAQRKADQFRGKTEDMPSPQASGGQPSMRSSQTINAAPDTNAQCDTWARNAECKNNRVWMMENCATSCAKNYIVDLSPRCPQWADDGECENNKIYMQHHCPASCGGMLAPAPAPGDTTDFSRAKRAADLKKQSKPAVKATVVRGKEVNGKVSKELGGGPKTFGKSEEALLDMLADIPSV
jgi:hypothetical protein